MIFASISYLIRLIHTENSHLVDCFGAKKQPQNNYTMAIYAV